MPKRQPRRPRRADDRFNPLKLRKTESMPLPKSSAALRTDLTKARPGSKWLRWLHWPRRPHFHFTWKKFFIYLAGFIGAFTLLIAGVFAYYIRDLPNPKQLSSRPVPQSTQILDRNGKQIYNFYGNYNRTLLTPDKINDYSKEATISIEDSSFYTNPGFDLKGIARAVVCRVIRTCVAGGGSTITQQYIKNALLDDKSQTITRKLKELILSIEVEQLYSKEQILTGYLNEIPYGGSTYGLEAASQSFFNKSAKDLTLAQAATLAAIPQRPTYFSPYGDHLDALFRRKDYILDRMALLGYITQDQANAAKKDAPNSDNPDFAKRQDLVAPHFVFYVRQQLLDYIGGDPSLAEAKLDQGGYVVTTSLDLDTQKLAESIMQDMGPSTVKTYQASNAALTAVDPNTGEILAMVGSIDYEDSKSGNTNFANALLQPGSSFKPFVYATAFDKDHKKSPASVTYDLQTDFGNYTPQNYSGNYSGPITDRNALAESLNIPAVKNLYMAGISDSIATAQKLGISTLTGKPSDYGLSLVLGSGEVKPVEMADAYGTFATNGVHHALRPILKIVQNGKVLKDYTQDQGTQVIEPQVAYQITSILSDNNARTPVFGAKNHMILPDRPVATKTGTTQSNRDAWTIGYTPQIVTAVWVGNNEPNKHMTSHADGSVVAAPIWQRFMEEYLKGKPVVNFTQPDGLKQVTVDMLSGKLPTDQSPADQRVTDLFADWQIPTDYDDVHVKVKIDKVTGKLATDLTPAEDVIEQTFFNVHSEEPDKPNWEAPVQAWAQAHGGGTSPPTQQDDVHTTANEPTVSFVSPQANAAVNGTFTIQVTPGGPQAITSVQFFINNVSIGTVSQAPWSIQYDASSLPAGSQIIQATATNSFGLTHTEQISVTHQSTTTDTTPPGPVSGATIVKIPNKGLSLHWTNPSDTDLASVAIYASTGANVLGAKVQSVAATPGVAGSVDLTNLTIGTTYYFTFRPVDATGNENGSTAQVSATVTP